MLTDREAGSPHLDEESEATSHLVVGRTVRTRSTQTSVHPLPTHHARPINKQPLTTAWRCRLRASESSPGAKVRLPITDALPQSQRPRRGAAGTRPSGHSGLPSSRSGALQPSGEQVAHHGAHGHAQEAPGLRRVPGHDLRRGGQRRHHGAQQRRAVQPQSQPVVAGGGHDVPAQRSECPLRGRGRGRSTLGAAGAVQAKPPLPLAHWGKIAFISCQCSRSSL